MKKYDLIIIGAGSGGLSAAAGAAKLGLKVLLVEKNKLGGDCLWNGCIPSKTLIHEAEKMRIINEEIFPNGNNENTDKIIFDFQKHFKEAQKRILAVQMAISEHDSKQHFESLGVDVEIGEAKFFSKNKIIVKTDFGEEKYFKFKKCIVATGSRPRIPENFRNVQFYTNETFFDMAKLPKSMIVIGGGSIGVEMASAMSMFGVKIKMILKEDRIMPKEEKEIGDFMMQKMRESLGIEFYNFADIKEVYEREIEGQKIIHVDIGGDIILKAETLLVCVGRLFNTNIDLEKAGINYSPKGIEIDQYLKTTNKKVYAIGDVNGFRLFTHAAGYQAKAALQNLIIPNWLSKILPFLKKKSLPNAFPWVTYTYPEVAHVGNYKQDLDNEKIIYKEYITKLESVDRARTAKINEEGFIQVLVGKNKWYKSGGKILGVTIVAPHAGELITEWVLAMQNNLPVEAIFNTVHAYPTLSELNPRGTFEYMSEKLTPFRSKLLRLLFRI